MKRLILAGLVSGLISSGVVANDSNITAHSAFKADLADIQDKYYRSLRISDWVAMGATESDLVETMAKLKPSKEGGLIDKDNSNDPSHWTYEFTKTAAVAESKAASLNTAEAYDRASTVYLVASYPNLNRPNEIAALDKAVDLYLKAAELRGENVQKVSLKRQDGRSVTGILHLPKGGYGKKPAIIWTGGVDKTLIEHKNDFDRLLGDGYAILTLDMPGAGLDYKNHLTVGDEAVSHIAALDYLSNHPSIDAKRIGALSSSGSGPALMDFAIKKDDQLKAVVARCALVDGPIGKKATLKYIPEMSAHSFIARMGGDTGDMDYFRENAPKFSLANKGLLDGKARMDTPLLVINTKKDPVAPIEDMKKTAALSTNGEVFISNEFGHCPDTKEAKDKIYEFLKSNV